MNVAHPVIGIDGEGYTDRQGRHRYTYIAACTADKLVSELHRPKGIRSQELFDWLLSLPREATLVGFSLGYDQTKWIEDLPDGAVWALMRPEAREGKSGHRSAVKWKRYRVDRISRRFSVSAGPKTQRIVWDVWAFYQTSFVKALDAWEVGSKAERDRIARMKRKRQDFATIGPEERAYCRTECKLLAALVRQLLDAHAQAGIELTALYGPGSTAKVMLDMMGASEHNVRGSKRFMRAVECAFFGGRFETSMIGPVEGPLYSYDLASAYPYAWCLLPCFKHGRWKHVSAKACMRALGQGRLALVRYRLDAALAGRPRRPVRKSLAWGSLPHRLPDGNIVFPAVSGGGWAWSPEVVAGQALGQAIVVREGYVFQPACGCGHPFRSKMVAWYRERLKWGKKGKGRVLRLGLNSCTGKAMQRVGKNPYRCLVRAGLVTSYTRARLLEAIACARDPWDVVEVATDSVLSKRPLKLPPPIPLGIRAGTKTLGAWDPSPVNDEGAFLCRPGQRFKLDGQAGQDDTASRGMSVRWLHANRARIMHTWSEEPCAPVDLPPPEGHRLFIGAKAGVSKHRTRWEFKRKDSYGRWVIPKARKLSYSPMPKRELLLEGFRLGCWELPQGAAYESVPYSKAPVSPLVRAIQTAEDERECQG